VQAYVREYLHMPTNLDIDPRLLEQAVKVSGERTKTAAVARALREHIARHELRRTICPSCGSPRRGGSG